MLHNTFLFRICFCFHLFVKINTCNINESYFASSIESQIHYFLIEGTTVIKKKWISLKVLIVCPLFNPNGAPGHAPSCLFTFVSDRYYFGYLMFFILCLYFPSLVFLFFLITYFDFSYNLGSLDYFFNLHLSSIFNLNTKTNG